LKSKRRSGPTSVATRFHSPADFGRWGYYLIDDVLEKLNAAVACLKGIAINHFPHLAVFSRKAGHGKRLPDERGRFSKRSQGIVASDLIKAGATAL
jgi:hypothetical protein